MGGLGLAYVPFLTEKWPAIMVLSATSTLEAHQWATALERHMVEFHATAFTQQGHGQMGQAAYSASKGGVLGMALAAGLATALYPGPRWLAIQRRLPLMLSVPHAAFAVGLLFLISPSGWLARAVAPLAGWIDPPAWTTVQDPLGLSLALALGLKESWFLLWVLAALLGEQPVRRQMVAARTLGYSRAQALLALQAQGLIGRAHLPVRALSQGQRQGVARRRAADQAQTPQPVGREVVAHADFQPQSRLPARADEVAHHTQLLTGIELQGRIRQVGYLQARASQQFGNVQPLLLAELDQQANARRTALEIPKAHGGVNTCVCGPNHKAFVLSQHSQGRWFCA